MASELDSIEIPGLRLSARVWGAERGAPVLALHGWLDNAASFDALSPLLPELRIVALDLPGHGLSQHYPVNQAYHFVDWLVVVFDVADALGWGRFSLLGHSMGAAIASLAAGVFPERIERLALLEGLGPMSGEAKEAPRRVARYLRGRAQARRPPQRYTTLEAAAQRLAQAVKGLGLPAARRLAERGTRQQADGIVWRSDPRLRAPSLMPFTEDQVLAFLQRVSARALLVVAERGWPFDRTLMQNRVRMVDGLRVVHVPGRHHVHLDDAATVAPLIRELFELGPV